MIAKKQIIYTAYTTLILIGYVYTLDWPEALQTPLRQQPYSFSSYQFNMIYFVTNLPICLLGIPIGMLLDKIKLSKGLILIISLCFISQLSISFLFLFSFSGFYIVLLILRGIFGLTGEAAYTVQALAIQRLGSPNYDTIMGISLTVPLMFNSMQSFVTTSVYDKTHQMWIPLLICSSIIFISLLSSLGLVYEIKQNNIDVLKNQNEGQQSQSYDINTLKKFNYAFWLIILLVFLCENGLGGFIDNSIDLIVKRFQISYTDAGKIMMIPFGFTPFGAILWGKFIKKLPNYRRFCFIVISLIIVISHIMIYSLINTQKPGFFHYFILTIALFIFSIGFAGLQTILIPSIAVLLPSNLMGTGFGISGCACSLSQTIMPIFNSIIISDKQQSLSKNYRNLSILYLTCGVISLIISICMIIFKTQKLEQIDRNENIVNQSLIQKKSQNEVGNIND